MSMELEKLKRKLRRLERQYDKAKGPLERHRIMKAGAATAARINKLLGRG